VFGWFRQNRSGRVGGDLHPTEASGDRLSFSEIRQDANDFFSLENLLDRHRDRPTRPNTKHRGSPYMPAFNSLDMVEVIERHQPTLWVYGHTHECDDQTIGRTRIISNQLGYPANSNAFECQDFDEAGVPIDIGT